MVHHPPVRLADAVLERLQDVGAGHFNAVGEPDGLWQVAEFTERSDGGAGRKLAERDNREGCGADGPEPAASTALAMPAGG